MPKFIRKLNNKSETLSKASSRISSQLLTSMLREDKKKSMLLHFCSSLETIKSWTISNCSETHSSIKEKLKLFYFSILIEVIILHLKKQPWFLKPFVKALQSTLRETSLGKLFFAQVATPRGVKNALSQAYHDKTRVTDELVEAILKPGLEPGAVDVFLDFISYSGGPLPEDLLPKVNVPVYIGWGEEDPWYVGGR